MKSWKRDLAYIREVGPDDPRFDAAVQRVWDRCEKLEAALELAVPQLRRLADIIDGRHEAHLVAPHGQSSAAPHRALDAAREALS